MLGDALLAAARRRRPRASVISLAPVGVRYVAVVSRAGPGHGAGRPGRSRARRRAEPAARPVGLAYRRRCDHLLQRRVDPEARVGPGEHDGDRAGGRAGSSSRRGSDVDGDAARRAAGRCTGSDAGRARNAAVGRGGRPAAGTRPRPATTSLHRARSTGRTRSRCRRTRRSACTTTPGRLPGLLVVLEIVRVDRRARRLAPDPRPADRGTLGRCRHEPRRNRTARGRAR